MVRTLRRTGIVGRSPVVNSVLTNRRLCVSPRLGTRQAHPLSSLSFSTVLDVRARAVKKVAVKTVLGQKRSETAR